MIKTAKDLKYYMECDKKALDIPGSRKSPRPILDNIWKYEILLRKCEYYNNSKRTLLHKILYAFYHLRRRMLGQKLGYTIGMNVFGPGLGLAHYGTIVINGNARFGKNCRVHQGVTVGSTNGSTEAPQVGDNCFLGSGCSVIGNIKLGNNVAVGAGAVVVNTFDEDNITLGGVPAKVISKKGSHENLSFLDIEL